MLKKNKWIQFFIVLLLTTALTSEAKLLQILHTNDTHSFMDASTHSTNMGGSARLKSLIDFYKDKASKEDIPTLTLDAGDFSEGNSYYMADRGRKSFEVQNQMGYDMVVLGNHDYLMGPKELDKLLGEIDFNFDFLAANIHVTKNYPHLKNKIKPFKEIQINGIKIAVLGLTTKEIFYTWSLKPNYVLDPYKTAKKYEKHLKNRKNDFIFALTHIGVKKDIKLAKETSAIDLIIGGHSHSALFKPEFEQNRSGILVPIVQAGMHTEYLGKIIIDLEKGKPLKVISYELVPVKYESQDATMKELVAEADMDLAKTYGEKWLNEKIGFSDLKKDDPSGSRKWAYFIADALKEKANSDVAIHAPPMNGENFPVGDVTRRVIMNSFPRVFELTELNGWSIYTAKLKGIWLKTVFETLTHFGEPLAFSGMTMEFAKTPFGHRMKNVRINGKKINMFKEYTVAFTEGVIRGALEISPKTKILLKDPSGTRIKIWKTLEDKMVKDGKLLKTMKEDGHTFYYPDL